MMFLSYARGLCMPSGDAEIHAKEMKQNRKRNPLTINELPTFFVFCFF
jgi:hypothetical protein